MKKENLQKNKVAEAVASKVGKRRALSGVVVSDKMKDTVVVLVERYTKHPKYQKFMHSQKRYKAHDAGNTLKIGDEVHIVESALIFHDKRFNIVLASAAAK